MALLRAGVDASPQRGDRGRPGGPWGENMAAWAHRERARGRAAGACASRAGARRLPDFAGAGRALTTSNVEQRQGHRPALHAAPATLPHQRARREDRRGSPPYLTVAQAQELIAQGVITRDDSQGPAALAAIAIGVQKAIITDLPGSRRHRDGVRRLAIPRAATPQEAIVQPDTRQDRPLHPQQTTPLRPLRAGARRGMILYDEDASYLDFTAASASTL